MRNWAKYLLTAAVVGIGFYAAQQHRLPDHRPGQESAISVSSLGANGDDPERQGRKIAARGESETLPVAALTDVDRTFVSESELAAGLQRNGRARIANVTNQPTVRRAEPAGSLADKKRAPVADTAKRAEATERSSGRQPSREPDFSEQPSVARPPQAPRSATPKRGELAVGDPAAGAQASKKNVSAEPDDANYAPPELAREYHPLTETRGAAPNARPAARNQAAAGASVACERADLNPNASSDERPAALTPAGDRLEPETHPSAHRHRIVEGDTLPQLAERYLGSHQRYREIYLANQDILFDPQFIPIGVEITIPDRTDVMARGASDVPERWRRVVEQR